ncbi:MAG: hypothetical protein AAGJ10_16455 [Bacteroidota bacterium]
MELPLNALDDRFSSDRSVKMANAHAVKHKALCQRLIVQRLRSGFMLAVWPERAQLYRGHRMHSPCYLPAARALISEGTVLPIGVTADERGVLYGLAIQSND